MGHSFDQQYWQTHWEGSSSTPGLPAHPSLDSEIAALEPGTALEAGSGQGAEALWLAQRGWQVTAVDISAQALEDAGAAPAAMTGSVTWIEADLTTWEPAGQFDLVTTFYAHPTIGQLPFYQRIGAWVKPGGRLLLVGHDHGASGEHSGQTGGHAHPVEAVADLPAVVGWLEEESWQVQTAQVRSRQVSRAGQTKQLQDVVVLARRAGPGQPAADGPG